MINLYEAQVDAWVAIAELVGRDYFRSHFDGSCNSHPSPEDGSIESEFFLGFEGDSETNK